MAKAPLAFVTCANDCDVLSGNLLASPCIRANRYPLAVHFGCTSAAWAFNREMAAQPISEWLVWVHQDVYLPHNWDRDFLAGIAQAEQGWPNVDVVGLYGITQTGTDFRPVGHVVDRGSVLFEKHALPVEVSSIDELLLAVRVSSGLLFDPALGFDFYGTDIVLKAQAAGGQAVVVDAPCEHRSTLPRQGAFSASTLQRMIDSANVFEHKWAHRLPVRTSCFFIEKPGDTGRFIRSHAINMNP